MLAELSVLGTITQVEYGKISRLKDILVWDTWDCRIDILVNRDSLLTILRWYFIREKGRCYIILPRRFYLTEDLTYLYPLVQGSLKWPICYLFSTDASVLWNHV